MTGFPQFPSGSLGEPGSYEVLPGAAASRRDVLDGRAQEQDALPESKAGTRLRAAVRRLLRR